MDERPSELEQLAAAVRERGRGEERCAKPPVRQPSGGHEAVATPRQLTSKEWWQALGGLLMFIVIVAALYEGCTSFGSSGEQIQEELDAVAFARRLVKQRLSFPEEAEFPWGTTRAMPGQEGIWTIIGEVVTKNAFGVRSRKEYTCQLQAVDDGAGVESWEVRILEIYDP